LAGILIQFLVFYWIGTIPWLAVILVLVFGFLSHGILDPIAAKFTYHRPDPKWDDKFWLGYHIGMYTFTLFIVMFFIQYWLGMLASIIVDLFDWGARALKRFKFLHLDWYTEPYVHNIVNKPLLYCLKGIKGDVYSKSRVIPEIIIDVVLLACCVFFIYF